MKKLILFLVVLNLITFGQTAEEYNDKGDKKYDLEDYKGAIADYNKAIQLKPDYALAYYSRGTVKYNLTDYKGAITDYNKAIQLNPSDTSAYYNRGLAKYNLQDYTGAITDYNKYIQLKPDDADAYYNRGGAKDDLKDYIGAISDYNKAIRLNPDYAKTYNSRGTLKYNLVGMWQLKLNDKFVTGKDFGETRAPFSTQFVFYAFNKEKFYFAICPSKSALTKATIQGLIARQTGAEGTYQIYDSLQAIPVNLIEKFESQAPFKPNTFFILATIQGEPMYFYFEPAVKKLFGLNKEAKMELIYSGPSW
jgi:tetratricopeptide (TPR) repeat protein